VGKPFLQIVADLQSSFSIVAKVLLLAYQREDQFLLTLSLKPIG